MKIEHVALYVNDLEAAKDFFVRYLDAVPNAGYHNPRTDFRSYFLTFADGARLELMNKPGMPDEPKPAARTGYAHIAFSTGSMEAVDALRFRQSEEERQKMYLHEIQIAVEKCFQNVQERLPAMPQMISQPDDSVVQQSEEVEKGIDEFLESFSL